MNSKKMVLAALSTLLVGVVACGSSDSSHPGDPAAASEPVDPRIQVAGYEPGPLKPGFTRFVTPVVRGIVPGADEMLCQYMSTPYAKDTDIADLEGSQSKGGHHVIFYAVKFEAPVGTSRKCNENDMSRAVFLGGIGGEGASAIGKTLPPGTVFRIPKGYSLMANVHFVNPSAKAIDGQGVIDLKLADPDPSKKAATLFVNVATDGKLVIPAHQTMKMDLNCKVEKDLELYMFGNHMHEHGSSAFSELVRVNGSKEMLKKDEIWNPQDTFNPNFNIWPAAAPMLFKKGDVVHTHCEYNNTTDTDLRFPSEMCVGFGMFLGSAEVDCIDGSWPAGE